MVETMTKHNTTRKIRLRALGIVLASVAILGACGGDSETVDTATIESSVETEETIATQSTDATTTAACPDQTVIDEAVKEGQVNLIALPDNWANYKGILQAFRDKYPGVNNPVANPDASSADELTAVKTLAGQPDMPDALDVSPAIAQQVADEGLWAPYKPCAWDEIPDNL